MGLFSFFDDVNAEARRKINEEARREAESLEEKIVYMRLQELGEYYTRHFATGSSIAYRAKLIAVIMKRIREYSERERKVFVEDYHHYKNTIDINFYNWVKNSLK